MLTANFNHAIPREVYQKTSTKCSVAMLPLRKPSCICHARPCPLFVSVGRAHRVFTTAVLCLGCVSHLPKHGFATRSSTMIFLKVAAEVAPLRAQLVWPSAAAGKVRVDATAVSHLAGQLQVPPSLVPLLTSSLWAERNWRMLHCFPKLRGREDCNALLVLD